MKGIVLDCSVTMAWCFDDEATDFTNSVLDAVEKNDVAVPTIWGLEVVNVLVCAERKGRSTAADSAKFIAFLQELPIRMDEQSSSKAFGNVLGVARSQRLSAYNAAYLELAMREGYTLATQDADLRKAASDIGAALFRG